MTKKRPRVRRRSGTVAPITRVELAKITLTLNDLKRLLERNGDEIAAIRQESAAHIRRFAELQSEIDRVKKLVAIA